MITEQDITKMEMLAKKLHAPVFSFPKYKEDWKTLITIVLSSRTKDEITIKASKQLFSQIKRLEQLVKTDEKVLQKLIFPVAFFRIKSKKIKALASCLLKKFNGQVPISLKELCSLPGVGRKTARVFQAIKGRGVVAVDTHVHRIANRIGIVKTKTPIQTEQALAKQFPPSLLKKINKVFVAYGQTVCLAKKPRCNECIIKEKCNTYKQGSTNGGNELQTKERH